MSTMSYLARRFVAGEKKDEALHAVKLLNASGIIASLDVLGENVANEEEARMAADEYVDLLNTISQQGVRSNVSMKLTQMGLDISEDFCFANALRIIEQAHFLHNFVRLDMEGSAYTERTLKMFYRLFERFPEVGVVIQAYLHRSEVDAEKLAAVQAPVRVCKGAYKESPSIAYKDMDDIRQNYKRLVEVLIKGGSKVGIATHDERLIQWAREWTTKNKIPREKFEFQMLYGLRRKRAIQLAKEGYTVRSYVPYGTHWLPYFVRRLRERKENIFFVLKSLVAD